MITVLTYFAVACSNKAPSFLGLPTWYKYLPTANDALGNCVVQINHTSDYALIGLALIDIMLRLAGLIAVGYVIYGGFKYMLSQGEPDRTKNAQDTVINALIGLGIVLVAVGVVAFVARRLGA